MRSPFASPAVVRHMISRALDGVGGPLSPGGRRTGRRTTAIGTVAVLLAVCGCQSNAGSDAAQGKGKPLPGIKELA